MKQKNLEEVVKLVKEVWPYECDKILTGETYMGKNLRICGDDTFEIIEMFAARFQVDISNSQKDDYFKNEGDSVFQILANLFRTEGKGE